jgi:hypothetical protein
MVRLDKTWWQQFPTAQHRCRSRQRERTSGSAAASVGRWDIRLANDAYRRTRRAAASREACQFQRTAKGKGKGKEISLLATLNVFRTGGLAARPGSWRRIVGRGYNLRKWGHDVRVLLSTYGGRGDVEPVVGLAVRLRALGAQVRVCAPPKWAERPADSSEGRQPEMRTCPTRGSTELEAPVIRSASAVQRSTATSEVSQ